jgi:hypothetical protein
MAYSKLYEAEVGLVMIQDGFEFRIEEIACLTKMPTRSVLDVYMKISIQAWLASLRKSRRKNGIVMAGKYAPLDNYLRDLPESQREVTLRFEEIERILNSR